MGFLNAALLFGAATLVVPLIIHLLNRSRFRVLEWGAMHLLESLEPTNSRRIQWESLLLLLIRCGIPLALAACMARPILTAWRVAGGGGSTALAFVLDDSYSMQAPAATGEASPGPAPAAASAKSPTAFHLAGQQIEQIAAGMGPGAQLALVTLGEPPRNATEGATYDAQRLARVMAAAAPNKSRSQPGIALALAGSVLAFSPQAQRHLIVVSDFQRGDWLNLNAESLTTLRELRGSAAPPHLTLIPVSTQPTENLQVTLDVEFTEVVGVGEPLDVRATLRNWGTQPAEAVRVTWRVDDADLAAKVVNVAPHATTQVQFGCSFDRAGDHRGVVAVEEPSPIETDNTVELPIQVVDDVHVLFVESAATPDLLQTETGYLELALQSPGAAARDGGWLRTQRLPIDKLTAEAVAAADVIVLANVARLPDQAAQWVEKRVQDGAGLWVFAGPRLELDWYRQRWSPHGAAAILPLEYRPLSPSEAPTEQKPNAANPAATADVSAASTTALAVAKGPYDHPALALFNHAEQGRLDSITARSWLRMTPWPQPDQTAAARPGNDSSAAAQPDEPAADEPAADQSAASETAVVIAAFANGDPFLVEKKLGQGRVIQCATSCNDAWTNLPLRPAFVPLMHRLLLSTVHAPVAIPRRTDGNESELQFLSPAELKTLAANLGAELQPSADDFLQAVRLRSVGKEFWRSVLAGLVVLMFAELLLEKRLSRGGR